MKVFFIDPSCGLSCTARDALDNGHEVRVFHSPNSDGTYPTVGDGYFDKTRNLRAGARWADLIVLGDNAKYISEIQFLFNQGYPIFGPNPEAGRMELDRNHGQELCAQVGMPILPYETFTHYDDAIAHVTTTMDTFVCKLWGGSSDKDSSYVSKSPEDMIWKLNCWKRQGRLKGKLILQKKAGGIEMAVGGWFGPGGWASMVCENWEEKKFMNDNLGSTTGEQGTTLRYVHRSESKLFHEVLEPMTGHLHRIGYVGYIDQNCIIDKSGTAWPLEFTCRFGYPLWEIQQPLHRGDVVEWMYALLHGQDTLQVSSDVSVGVVLSHGQYPYTTKERPKECNVPIRNVPTNRFVRLDGVQLGSAPVRVGNTIQEIELPVTAGTWLGTMVGCAPTVDAARDKAYNLCWKIDMPSNLMFRTDIAKRLEDQLPELQRHGYATGMTYK